MEQYSDPTASMALGDINREFSRLEKKAKRLAERYHKGEITADDLAKAQTQFTGIYRHVLTHALQKKPKEN